MVELINRMIAPLRRRISLMITRVVFDVVKDAGETQTCQVQGLADEVMDNIEVMGMYGYTAIPLKGAEGIMVSVGGNRDHGVIIAHGDRRYRLKGLQDGEVALWDDLGSKVHLKRGGKIEVTASSEVEISCPSIKLSGALSVTGEATFAKNVAITGNVTALDCISAVTQLTAFYQKYLTHIHTGVTTGPGSSGPPAP